MTSGIPNLALLDGDHQVAREHDLAPAGQGRTVDGGDDRLGEVALGDAAEAALGPHDVAGLAGGERLQVHAGAERLVPGAGDDDHPAVVVGLELVEGGRESPRDGPVDGVAGLGPVDGEDLDVTPAFAEQFGHGGLPWWSQPVARR